MEEGLLADVAGEHFPSLIPQNDDLRHVLDVLCAGGYGAWVVGGAVRDCILGTIPSEYDICTNATPQQIIESFEDTIPTGERFGTITVKSGESLFEITTLRTETGYGDGRRPDAVEWGDSLAVDLSRRDFTMNSMAYDCARELLHDPYKGRIDLQNGNLRAVGKASQRLSEDGLRIMRAYRFMDRSQNGVWFPDNELSDALVEHRSMLAMVSIERIWAELKRIIIGKNAHVILSRMNRDGVLGAIIGYPISLDLIDNISKLEPDLEARLAMMFLKLKSNEIDDILKRLKVSKNTFSRTKKLHFLIHNYPDANELRLYRNELGEEVLTHGDLLDSMGKNIDLIKKALQYPTNIECLIDGDWIMEKTGLGPGIRLGRLKEWLFRIQIERGYQDLAQIETALCTISWNHGNPEEWPKARWP